jgi:hypothetical protein
MQRNTLLIFAGLVASTGQISAQNLVDTIVTLEKAIPAVNQTLSGLWLSELRRPGPNGPLPPIPTVVNFFPDGTSIGAPADGTQTPTLAMWIRVGDRKFLGTGYFFGFNENRVLMTITKLRINYQLSADGRAITGTTEAVIMDPTGTVMATLPGATFSMTRLSLETPADFDEFQKLP